MIADNPDDAAQLQSTGFKMLFGGFGILAVALVSIYGGPILGLIADGGVTWLKALF